MNRIIEIIRKLDGLKVSLSLVADNMLRIEADRSDITLNMMDLDDYPELQERLIVTEYDNIQSISNQINKALKHRFDIQKNSNLFLNNHNTFAQQKINEILF